MTPVISNTPSSNATPSTLGSSTFNHVGHAYTSIFLIFPYFLFAGVFAVSSEMKVSTSGVRSSIRTFIAFRMAFSRIAEIPFFSL